MAADVKPIRSEADSERALAEFGRLWGARAGTPKGDRLDVLATLIDAWEAEHHPMDRPDPVEAIKFRMERQGLSRRDLEAMIGTRSRVAEVLNRKRNLSIGMIRRLQGAARHLRRGAHPPERRAGRHAEMTEGPPDRRGLYRQPRARRVLRVV